MVISYSIKELYSIGEMVVLRDCLAQMQNNSQRQHPHQPNSSNNDSSITSTDSETATASNHSFNQHTIHGSPPNQQNSGRGYLSMPVAQFFEKLGQSCHFQPQLDIQVDVNKVRLHSEVESELFSCSRP